MRLHARQHVLRLHRLGRVFIIAHLVINAPDIIGLAMHQNGGAWVGRRVKPREALYRLGLQTRRFLHHIHNHIAAFVLHALERQAQLLAHGASPPIASDEPICAKLLAMVQTEHGVIAVVHHLRDARIPAHGDHAGEIFLSRTQRIFLNVILLDIRHRCKALRSVMRHVKFQHFIAAKVASPARPRQAFIHHRLCSATPIQNF